MTRGYAPDVAACAVALALLLLWDASGFDLTLLRMVGDASGFAWRDQWFARGVLHEGGRALGWAVFAALALNLRWPLPFARDLSHRDRLWWFATTLTCLLLIELTKRMSLTSCPWSLAEFGGSAHFVSHWAFGVRDGGPGGCFPSGHASGAFSFLCGWFLLRRRHRKAACWWLAATLGAGLAFGIAQTLRGAHPPSHTLWTAWICLAVSTISYHGFARWRDAGRRSTAIVANAMP